MLLLVKNIYVFLEDFSKLQVSSSVRYLKSEKKQIKTVKDDSQKLLYSQEGLHTNLELFAVPKHQL